MFFDEINAELEESEIELRVRLITALIDGSPMQTGVEDVELFIDRVQAQAEQIAVA